VELNRLFANQEKPSLVAGSSLFFLFLYLLNGEILLIVSFFSANINKKNYFNYLDSGLVLLRDCSRRIASRRFLPICCLQTDLWKWQMQCVKACKSTEYIFLKVPPEAEKAHF